MEGLTTPAVEHLSSTDPDEAAALVSGSYLPHQIHLPRSASTVDMDLSYFQLGDVTVGRLTYGQQALVVTERARDFYVGLVLRGRSEARQHGTETVVSTSGQGVVFSPGSPCEVVWSPDCVQLCLKVDAETLERELERLLGEPLREPLRFELDGGIPEPLAHRWQTVLRLLIDEVQQPSGLVTHRHAGRYVEKMVLDGLLLAHHHNYSDAVRRPGPQVASQPVRKAVDLLEADPARQWSVVDLATEVHLSVRSLQEGFRRELDDTPLSYLKKVRLRRARWLLIDALPDEATVKGVAAACGFLHTGRFAAEYKAAFGEHPSDTLRATDGARPRR